MAVNCTCTYHRSISPLPLLSSSINELCVVHLQKCGEFLLRLPKPQSKGRFGSQRTSAVEIQHCVVVRVLGGDGAVANAHWLYRMFCWPTVECADNAKGRDDIVYCLMPAVQGRRLGYGGCCHGCRGVY